MRGIATSLLVASTLASISCEVREPWMQHRGTNCYSGHGATDLDSGHGCGKMSVAACQAKCGTLPACTGITVNSGAVVATCYRRSNITLTACVTGAYDTWTKASNATAATATTQRQPYPGWQTCALI